jgi:colicin import membrane protein
MEKPDVREAEIAQKAEALRKEQQRKEAEAKTQEEKRQADLRDRQQREVAAMRAQAERETRSRTQAEREAQLRAQAERESKDRAQQVVSDSRNRSQADWMDKIRAKVKSNVIEPPDLPGNPEAIFDVVLLPTCEVLEVQLRKSSGVRAYDDAVSRAILKSSPLPRPDRPEVFQRTLQLRVRPRD